ncbi:MAG: GAF domain-containing protein [Pseudomonadota bacterium]
MLDTISRVQSRFIAAADPVHVFNDLLGDFLTLTNSEYGFIGEIFYTGDNQPYLQTHAITNLAWNDETRAFYDANIATGLKFYNLNTLFGRVMVTGEPMIANHPVNHPHRGGIPEGHPPLNTFLGLPLYSGDTLVGMAGLANRPGGYDEKLIAHLQPMTNTCANLIQAHRNNRQRHDAEESLRTSQQQLQTVLDNLTSVVYVKNLQGHTLLVNNEGARRLGLDRPSIIGKTDYDLFPKEIAGALRARDKAALDAKAVVSGEETLPLDGKLHTFLSTRFPLFDASGNIYAL